MKKIITILTFFTFVICSSFGQSELTLKSIEAKHVAVKNEFSKNIDAWVYHKGVNHSKIKPNQLYSYFALDKDNKPFNFRLVLRSDAMNDNIDLYKIVFNIDGAVYEEKLNVNQVRVDIWGMICIINSADFNMSSTLRNSIKESKEIKIRMVGHSYSHNLKIKNKDIDRIKETIQYYELLGGK